MFHVKWNWPLFLSISQLWMSMLRCTENSFSKCAYHGMVKEVVLVPFAVFAANNSSQTLTVKEVSIAPGYDRGSLRNHITCDVIVTAFMREIYRVLPPSLGYCYMNSIYSLSNPPWLTKKVHNVIKQWDSNLQLDASLKNKVVHSKVWPRFALFLHPKPRLEIWLARSLFKGKGVLVPTPIWYNLVFKQVDRSFTPKCIHEDQPHIPDEEVEENQFQQESSCNCLNTYFADPKTKRPNIPLQPIASHVLPKSYKKTLEDCNAEINSCRCERSARTLLMFCNCQDYIKRKDTNKVTNKINDHNTRERSIRKPSIRKVLKEGTTQPFSSGTAPKRAEVLTTTRTTSSSIVGQVMEPVDLIDVEDYTTQETRFRRAGGGKSKKTKNNNKKQSREKKKKSKKRVKPALRARTTSMGAIGGSGGSDSGSGGEGVSGGAPPNNDKAPYWKYRRIGFDRWQADNEPLPRRAGTGYWGYPWFETTAFWILFFCALFFSLIICIVCFIVLCCIY